MCFVFHFLFLCKLHTTRKTTECLPREHSLSRGQESTTETPAASQDSAEKQSFPSEDRELKPSAESSTVSDDQTHTTTAPDTRKGKVSSTTFVYSMYWCVFLLSSIFKFSSKLSRMYKVYHIPMKKFCIQWLCPIILRLKKVYTHVRNHMS